MTNMTNDELIGAILRSLDENAKRFRCRMKVRKWKRDFMPSSSPASEPRYRHLTEKQLVNIITKALKENSKRVARRCKMRRKLSAPLLKPRPESV